MHKIYLLFTCLVVVMGVKAQSQQSVSIGKDYTKQVWFSLENGVAGEANLQDWDIAMPVDQDEYAIRINSGIGTQVWTRTDDTYENCDNLGSSCRGLQDYDPSVGYDTTGMAAGLDDWTQLFNSYEDWNIGALNQNKDLPMGNIPPVLNFGWGSYKATNSDPQHAIAGHRIFIIRLHDGTYKQFFCRASLSGQMRLTWANLDGSNVVEKSYVYADFPSKTFAYFSLVDNEVRDLEPILANWDLLFTSYNPTATLDAEGQVIQGVLHSKSATAAEADGVDVPCAGDFGLMYQADISTIGSDWKVKGENNFTIDEDRVYFVENEAKYKLVFTDFDSESTGTFDFNAALFPAALEASATATNETAFDANDGTAEASTFGGTCPHTYSWSNGSEDAAIDNLAPGEYTVTVTDADGVTSTATIVVLPFECNLEIRQINTQSPTCAGLSDGIAQAIVAKGTEPYQYEWNTGATTSAITNRNAGDYSVSVTDASNCTVAESVEIIDIPQLTIALDGTDENCLNCNNGAASVTANGANENNYAYKWSSGQITSTITGLSPGKYFVTVTSNEICTSTDSITINAYKCALKIDSISKVDPTCKFPTGGSAEVHFIIGDSEPFIQWSNDVQAAKIEGLTAGDYSVSMVDDEGCAATKSITLNAPESVILSVTQTPLSCNTCADGTATAFVERGAAPYSYKWSTGATTETITGLDKGTYFCTVTDSKGCFSEGVTRINEAGCDLVIVSMTSTDVSCFDFNDGTATAEVSTTNGRITYAWNIGDAGATITSLKAGMYSLTVEDEANCSETSSIRVNEPTEILTFANISDESCNNCENGSITVSSNGGAGNKTYRWLDNNSTSNTRNNLAPGEYCVITTDERGCSIESCFAVEEFNCVLEIDFVNIVDNNCNGANNGFAEVFARNVTGDITYNWSNGEKTKSINNLAAGFYTIVITDGSLCQAELLIAVDEPEALVSSTTVQHESGFEAENGLANIMVSGGSEPYTIKWSNGIQGASINNLAPGIYYATVTDNKTCEIIDSVEVLAYECELSLSLSKTDITCKGCVDGTATATATGNAAPFKYIWSNGGTTQTIEGLSAGSYKVTVIDAANCSVEQEIAVEPYPCQLVFTGFDKQRPVCSGESSGSLTVKFIGENGKPTINWSNGMQTAKIEAIPAGQYGVTVADEKGCSFNEGIELEDIDVISVGLNADSTSCEDTCADGSINTIIVGGVEPYSFTWNNGDTTEDISGLSPGVYTVTIVDDVGCEVVRSVTVEAKINIDLSVYDFKDISLEIFPNPVTDYLQIKYSQNVAIQVVAIYNSQGILVKTTEMSIDGNNQVINVSNLPVGNYHLIFYHELGQSHKTIIKL